MSARTAGLQARPLEKNQIFPDSPLCLGSSYLMSGTVLNATYESASSLQLFISPAGSRKRTVSPAWINPSTTSHGLRASGLQELWVAAKSVSSLDMIMNFPLERVLEGSFGNPGPSGQHELAALRRFPSLRHPWPSSMKPTVQASRFPPLQTTPLIPFPTNFHI